MKKFLLSSLLLCTAFALQAQNVGIGTTTPTYPLTVISDGSSKGIAQKAGTTEVGFYVTPGGPAYLQTWSPSDLYFTTNNGNAKIAITNSTGYVGIATTSPTAQLDVNGTFRLRGNGAAAGAVLTSDANGNATWQAPASGNVYSVGSVDFKSDHGDNPVWVSGGNGGAYYTTAYYGNLVAPVHLPDGAKVTQIRIYYLDNNASEDITFSFYGEANTSSYFTLATINTSGASNTFRLATITPSSPITIDNDAYNYQVNAFCHWPGSPSNLVVKSIKFTYSN